MRATTFKRERAEARAASPKSELDEGRPLLRLEDAAPAASALPLQVASVPTSHESKTPGRGPQGHPRTTLPRPGEVRPLGKRGHGSAFVTSSGQTGVGLPFSPGMRNPRNPGSALGL